VQSDAQQTSMAALQTSEGDVTGNYDRVSMGHRIIQTAGNQTD